MRKSLFAVAMAVILLATNCQKTEIMNPTGTSIGFDSQIGKLTKAADSEGVQTLQGYGFRVWAYRNFEDQYYAGADATTYPNGKNAIYDGMKALAVTYSDSKWATTKDYYWPGAEKQLKFFAVSCNETVFELDAESVVVPDVTSDNVTITGFEVKNNANNDLMVADLITQAQGDATNGNVVKPVFRHTLTKVQFNFKTDSETQTEHPVYILGIKTSELITKGTFKRSYPYEATADENAWELSSDTKSVFIDDNTGTITLPTVKDEDGNDKEITVDGDDKDRTGLTLTAANQTLDTWLLLPQDISTATVEITYIIKNRLFTKTFPLYADGLTKWGVNQFVKYNVTIAPNLISFNPSVEEWDTTDVTMDDNGTQVESGTETPTTPTPNTVTATLDGSSVTLYYNGELTVDTLVYKDDALTTPADSGTYSLEDRRTLTVDGGKITVVTPTTETV